LIAIISGVSLFVCASSSSVSSSDSASLVTNSDCCLNDATYSILESSRSSSSIAFDWISLSDEVLFEKELRSLFFSATDLVSMHNASAFLISASS
jgi:hypothetical protein